MCQYMTVHSIHGEREAAEVCSDGERGDEGLKGTEVYVEVKERQSGT